MDHLSSSTCLPKYKVLWLASDRHNSVTELKLLWYQNSYPENACQFDFTLPNRRLLNCGHCYCSTKSSNVLAPQASISLNFLATVHGPRLCDEEYTLKCTKPECYRWVKLVSSHFYIMRGIRLLWILEETKNTKYR